MRFRSSAKSVPHFQGTLQERINHPAAWCHKYVHPQTMLKGRESNKHTGFRTASLSMPLPCLSRCQSLFMLLTGPGQPPGQPLWSLALAPLACLPPRWPGNPAAPS
jgi:hypothetical protein